MARWVVLKHHRQPRFIAKELLACTLVSMEELTNLECLRRFYSDPDLEIGSAIAAVTRAEVAQEVAAKLLADCLAPNQAMQLVLRKRKPARKHRIQNRLK